MPKAQNYKKFNLKLKWKLKVLKLKGNLRD